MQSFVTKSLLVDTTRIILRRLNHAEFEQLCQDNPELRLELTATGELVTMPPAGFESSERNGDLYYQVATWNRQTQLGRTFESSAGFTLPSGAIKSPDVTWIEKSKLENIPPDTAFPLVVPDFVIELRSKTDSLNTLQAKMLEYQTNGVRLGWLIDPQNQQIEIYRLGRDVEFLVSPIALSGEETLPGFVMDLTSIW